MDSATPPVSHPHDGFRAVWHCAAVVLCTAGLISAAACDGDAPGDAGRSRRLAWNQAADSLQLLQALTFNLYIDGNLSSLSDVRCSETAGAEGYECSGGLPSLRQGPHVLELTAVLGSAESARAGPLAINLTSAAPLTAFVSIDGRQQHVEPAAAGPLSVCVAGAPECYEMRVVADGLGPLTGLSPTPDGWLFVIEDASRVRLITREALVAEPALVLDDPAGRIVGLAVDHDFKATRSVFVAWTQSARDAGLVVNVTRYRELRNVLAEGATVVAGLPVPQDAQVPLAVDEAGLLYVALPATSPQPPTGVILRYTRDGLTPRDNPRMSPVIAAGYSRPSDLAVDAAGGRLWLAGQHPDWTHGVSWISTTVSPDPMWPLLPVADVAAGSGTAAPRLAVVLARRPSGASQLRLTIDGRLFTRGLSSGADNRSMREIDTGLGPKVLGVAGGSEDTWYLVLDDGGAAAVFRVGR